MCSSDLSLRQIDRFGQKAAFEGNYKIQINATPGQAEAMKTDVFKIKHKNVAMGVSLNDQASVSALRVDNLPAGSYSVVTTTAAVTSTVALTGRYGFPETYHKLASALAGPVTAGNDGKQFKISVAGVVGEVTLDTGDTESHIAAKIRALNIKDLVVQMGATGLTLISTKGPITLNSIKKRCD